MKTILTLAALLAFSVASPSLAADEPIPEFRLTIKNHVFDPASLEIPADKKVKLLVKNEDASAEEFESHDLHREKVIAGGKEAVILVGPLKPGEYKFFGEYHEKTAQGKLIVK